MVAKIRLQQFRSYLDNSFAFDGGVNIIVGPNASGKTNLLEAVLTVARGGSYRARDAELVMFGKPWARLDAATDKGNRIVKIVLDPAVEKTYDIEGRIFRRLNMHHTIPAVLFEPNHLLLLSGSPDRRRDYLDELLAQTVVGYASACRTYRRALAQRNRLLKMPQTPPRLFFPWNVRLSELAGVIVRARTNLIGMLQQTIGDLYRDLAQSMTEVTVQYMAGAGPDQYESHMMHQLEARLPTDLQRGFTSYGPHREDFLVFFDGRPALTVASRGEVRTLVLALKVLELQILESVRNERPLLLLDDVFSELDANRRQALTAHLQTYQTFITTTDADAVSHQFARTGAVIPIAAPA